MASSRRPSTGQHDHAHEQQPLPASFRARDTRDRRVPCCSRPADGCGNGDSTAPTDPTPPDADGVVVRFATSAGDFLVVIEDEEALARLDGAEAGEHIGIPNGRIVQGDGGVNIGHDWHLVDVEIVDMTMEVCDGTVDYVDDLGYEEFVAQHGDRFCPWGATFEEIVS